MKRIWITLYCCVLTMHLMGQINLVPNPSFEDTVTCPFYYGQIFNSVGWSSYRNTPDYFNPCANSLVGVPQNDLGFQFARTGNSYSGLVTFQKFTVNYREYLGVQLSSPLVIGEEYFTKFYTTLAVGNSQHSNIATNKLGFRFSTVPFMQTNPMSADNFSHIHSDSIITDTTNWIEISGFYLADSSYQYLVIGNFYNDSATIKNVFDSTALIAYYYIDDVTVMDSITTGITENGNNGTIRMYPNFFNNELIIEGKYLKSATIYDMAGRICIEQDCTVSLQRIDTKSLSEGMYLITVATRDGTYSQKVVKQ